MSIGMNNRNYKVQRIVFTLYLILMPFEAFHPLQLNSIGEFAKSPSFLFHAIGFFLILLNSKGRIELDQYGCIKTVIKMVFAVSTTTIFMALILYIPVGSLAGQTTLDTIWIPMIYKFITITIIFYNFQTIRTLGFEVVKKSINIIIVYTLIIGYIQLFAILGISFFSSILSIMESLNITYSTDLVLNNSRVVLMFSEPSYAETLICGLIMPFLCANITVGNKRKPNLIKFLLFCPLVFYNASSSLMLGFTICVILLLVFNFNSISISKRKLIGILIGLSILIILFCINESWRELFVTQIFVKPFDNSNLSTIQRSSVIKNCLLIFQEYPILGCGNGIQGFFYESHLSANDYKSFEVLNALKYENGVPGAGSWAGGWLSGFGLFGVLLLVRYIYKTYKIVSLYKGTYLYYAYIISGCVFLVCSWFTASTAGGYLNLLALSIPAFIGDVYRLDDSEDEELIEVDGFKRN